jgi:hypothetical protein
MTEDQLKTLRQHIEKYASAREELGSIQGSYGWNSAYVKVEKAESEMGAYLKSLKSGD